ncbi:cysteine methyltransferase, partial [Xanthomonas oryzae pv. oryzae]
MSKSPQPTTRPSASPAARAGSKGQSLSG